jgi:hypothetical protein
LTAIDHQWTDPAFLAEAHAWIGTQVANADARLTGAVAQVHVRPWSTVLSVPTDRGPMYFKANHVALRHEAAVAALLSERRPDVVPVPVALDTARGWLLLQDAGSRLREVVQAERSVVRWADVLPLYASLQLDLAGAVDELLALGVPDMRLERLPDLYAALLKEIDELPEVPRDVLARAHDQTRSVVDMCRELAAYGIAETVQHDDLNDGQIYVRDGRYRVLDWGDACISHPFFSLSVALEGVIAWGVDDVEDSVDTAPFRDAYLQPFAERLARSMDELRAASKVAIRLGWACRAVNGRVAGEEATPTVRRLQMFLDGRV